MRRYAGQPLVCASALLGLLACAGPAPPKARPSPQPQTSLRVSGDVRIELASPRPDARVELASPRADARVELRTLDLPVWGHAQLPGQPDPEPLDVFVLLDVSYETRGPSGRDVDGDGEVGFDPHRLLPDLGPDDLRCTDPEDSILEAEVAAVHRLLAQLQAPTHRVGLGFFSSRGSGKARLLPLGTERSELRRTLDAARAREAAAPSLRTASRAARRALVQGRSSARRVLLVLHGGHRAVRAPSPVRGIEQRAFSVTDPGVGKDVQPLRQPGELLAWLADDEAAARSVEIRNQTLETPPFGAFLARDGSFSGTVPVAAGSNQLRVSLRRAGRVEGAVRFSVDVAPPPAPGREELAQRLDELLRRNRELLLLLEDPVPRGEPGDLQILVDSVP